jgi:hypothetical protein
LQAVSDNLGFMDWALGLMKGVLPSNRFLSGFRLGQRTEVPPSTIAGGQPMIKKDCADDRARRFPEGMGLRPYSASKNSLVGAKELPSRGQRLWSLTHPMLSILRSREAVELLCERQAKGVGHLLSRANSAFRSYGFCRYAD